MLRQLSQAVFGCFRRFEKLADRATSRVGPLFVALCTGLLLLGIVTFCSSLVLLHDLSSLIHVKSEPLLCYISDEVYFPRIFWTSRTSNVTSLFGLLWSLFLVSNLVFHYHEAVTVLPGSPHDPPGTMRRRSFWTACIQSARSMPRNAGLQAAQMASLSRETRFCKKCQPLPAKEGLSGPPKPERTHHCSVCQTCWLKYDHHCPWLNGCVGLHNERSFVLFMIYLSVACGSVSVLGVNTLLSTLDFGRKWPHWTPRAFTMLLWILSVAMAFSLGIMALWQLWLIAKGETTVEAHDNEYYRLVARRRQKVFLNPYDLGRRQNVVLFFNPRGSKYGWWSLCLPVSVPVASDGWRWPKRAGWESSTIEECDELTDEEDDGQQ